MYYRLYTIVFETSDGYKIYGGKRHSKFENPYDDPYTGSGVYIKRAIKKYGRDCIKSIHWSNDFKTPENLLEAEELLVDSLKDMYGDNCTNFIKGGVRGVSYFNPLDNPNIGKVRSIDSKLRMSKSAKNKTWTEQGLKRRQEATKKMTRDRKHADFSGDKNPAARKVKVGDTVYTTLTECGSIHGITKGAVVYRIKSKSSKWKDWNYDNI